MVHSSNPMTNCSLQKLGRLSHNNWAAMKNHDIYGLYGLDEHAVLTHNTLKIYY
jgi:hypothetical protein